MFLDKSKKKLRIGLIVIFLLIVTVIIDVLTNKKVHSNLEKIPAFYAFFGFISAFLIILVTYLMKKTGLKKEESYYD